MVTGHQADRTGVDLSPERLENSEARLSNRHRWRINLRKARCIENPRQEGRNTHQRRAASLHFMLNQHMWRTRSLFETARNIVSCAGICTGNNESAGKRKSGTTRNGNCLARRALCEAAWAAARAKSPYLSAQFRRPAALRGTKRAIVAVASTILTIGYHLLQRGTTYHELGGDYFDRRNLARTTKRLVKRLEGLGYAVILEPNHSRAAV